MKGQEKENKEEVGLQRFLSSRGSYKRVSIPYLITYKFLNNPKVSYHSCENFNSGAQTLKLKSIIPKGSGGI